MGEKSLVLSSVLVESRKGGEKFWRREILEEKGNSETQAINQRLIHVLEIHLSPSNFRFKRL